jgi:hypothetical protein
MVANFAPYSPEYCELADVSAEAMWFVRQSVLTAVVRDQRPHSRIGGAAFITALCGDYHQSAEASLDEITETVPRQDQRL